MSYFLAKLSASSAPVKDALSPSGLMFYQGLLLALWGRYGYRDPHPMPLLAEEGGGATLWFEGVRGRAFAARLPADGSYVCCVHEDSAGCQTSGTLYALEADMVADFARACFGEEGEE